MAAQTRPYIVVLLTILAVWISAVNILGAAEPRGNGPRQTHVPVLKVDQYALENGLKVILHEDHKTPLVGVNIVYTVGSKDDMPGRTGFAHLFEHLMFKGTLHNDQEFVNRLSGFAVETNGTTSRDRTVYFSEITTNALERTLWLEADRMGYLLPALTQEKLDIERKIVKNERLSRYDNVPYGLMEDAILAELYPPGHPYRHRTIGSIADVSAARLPDVRGFFERHYNPNQAFLCVAGDIESGQVKGWIKKYFGPLRRGAETTKPKSNVPRLAEPKHVKLFDRVSHACAQLIWPTVPAGHPDEEPLDILASVLGGLANENRLYRRCIHDEPLAVQVGASHPTYDIAGEFRVELYVQPERQLADLVRVADQEIERLKTEGPTIAELRRAQNEREMALVVDLESASGKASVLCQWAALRGDSMAYHDVIERVFAVTPADVARVARKYLSANRVELDVVPGTRAVVPLDIESKPAERAREPVPARDPFDAEPEGFAMPPVGPTPRFNAPKFVRRQLKNGLRLRIVERHDVPLVSLSLVVQSGETSTPKGKEGLCSITATLLDEGTKSRSALEIAGSLSDIGATISTRSGRESMEINLTSLTPYLDAGLDVYADVILNPIFADPDLLRLKYERLATLESAQRDAETIATDVFEKLVYSPGNPYGRPYLGTRESIKSIKRDDVVGFYRQSMVPGNAELVVVGDTTPEKILAALEKCLGSWRPGPSPIHPPLLAGPSIANQPLYLVDLPGAAQSIISVGGIGPNGASEQYNVLAIIVALTLDSIENKIREEKGNSYSFSSEHQFRTGPTSFAWTGGVQTSATKDSVVDVMGEVIGASGPKAASDDDITHVEASKAVTAFSSFETVAGVAFQIHYLVAYNLSDDYYATRITPSKHVTEDDIARVAKQYLTPEAMTILVVGDRSKIEGSLKSIPFIKSIRLLDTEGNPVPVPALPKSVVN